MSVRTFAYGSHGHSLRERWMMDVSNHLPAPDGSYVLASDHDAAFSTERARAELAEKRLAEANELIERCMNYIETVIGMVAGKAQRVLYDDCSAFLRTLEPK